MRVLSSVSIMTMKWCSTNFSTFIQDNGVGIAIVSILSPIPSTPLYARLAAEGRLVTDDPLVWFEPKLMSRATLQRALSRIEPAALFARGVFCPCPTWLSWLCCISRASSGCSGARTDEPRRTDCRVDRDVDPAPACSRQGGIAQRLRQDLSYAPILPKSARWAETRCRYRILSTFAFGNGIITRSPTTAGATGAGPDTEATR